MNKRKILRNHYLASKREPVPINKIYKDNRSKFYCPRTEQPQVRIRTRHLLEVIQNQNSTNQSNFLKKYMLIYEMSIRQTQSSKRARDRELWGANQKKVIKGIRKKETKRRFTGRIKKGRLQSVEWNNLFNNLWIFSDSFFRFFSTFRFGKNTGALNQQYCAYIWDITQH